MLVTSQELKDQFLRILLSRNISAKKAEECAQIFTETTESGVFSHGVNRFPVFIDQLDQGHIQPENEPVKLQSFGAMERWDGKFGIGNVNAKLMMQQATKIADEFGIGLVALSNTNHWMRGGHYSLQAAKQGYIGICWTNALGVVPPWGAKECRIGTNPLSIAVPGEPETLLDMSMSMFSYGALQTMRLAGQKAPVDAGFDDDGNTTKDPAIVEQNKRIMPMGYWKGSSMSILLDQMATLLTGGLSVAAITKQGAEYGVSQVFIAIALEKLVSPEERDQQLAEIKEFIMSAKKDEAGSDIRLPGHNLNKKIKHHQKHGMEIDDRIWQTILAL